MSNYNHVTLVGSLTDNPDTIKIGKKIRTKFTIGCERYTGEIDYFIIATRGKLAEVCKEYLKPGIKVLVDGKIQINKTPEGSWITEILADNIKFLQIAKESEKKQND